MSSELWSKAAADQNLDAASSADKCKLNLLSRKNRHFLRSRRAH